MARHGTARLNLIENANTRNGDAAAVRRYVTGHDRQTKARLHGVELNFAARPEQAILDGLLRDDFGLEPAVTLIPAQRHG